MISLPKNSAVTIGVSSIHSSKSFAPLGEYICLSLYSTSSLLIA